ncbi:DUF6894 family protein [Pararhizobium arenae]|uniref:DUF6894 family protein n=1 Tax=Pararhizobium arenae TaxID=1856850 RepID=UPI00094B5FBF|nr:hypothetical protein [Pararhizobium arenae]
MPRFFFHTRNGRMAVDREGLVFETEEEARAEAMRGASAMIFDNEISLWLGNSWVMTVVDEDGLVLYNLSFSIDRPNRQPRNALQ